MLLANHGPVVAGSSLADAQFATEELEETAKLYLMLRSLPIRPLTSEQVRELREKYNLRKFLPTAPSFLPSLSKSELFLSKLFQRFLWRF